MIPDFYKCPVTVPPGATRTMTYRPRDFGSAFGFFFDKYGGDLLLTSVKIGVDEQLVAPAPALLFVLSLPIVNFPLVRIGLGADVTFQNPTGADVPVTVWIGERQALRAELARLCK